METQTLSADDIEKGAAIIKAGGLVAFPTETVYGLGADATNLSAVMKIFDVKGRPAQNPLIVHFESLDDLFVRIPEIDSHTKNVLLKIKEALTVVIKRPKWIPAMVSAGLDTVAVRVPSCEFARSFIKTCGTPLAAPSANTSGRPSSTRWQQVYVDLKGKIDAVFSCEPTRIGVESTVIKVLEDRIAVLRLGGISTAQLNKATGLQVVVAQAGHEIKASPGTQFKHYAPTCRMVVAKYGQDMTQRIQEYIKGKKATVIFWQGNAADYSPNVVYLGKNFQEIAHNFYSAIRAAEWGSEVIVCEGFPETAEYETLNERAARAAEGNLI